MAEIEKKGLTLESALDGSGMRVGIVHTRWNADVVNALVSGAEAQLVCGLFLPSVPTGSSVPTSLMRWFSFPSAPCRPLLRRSTTWRK